MTNNIVNDNFFYSLCHGAFLDDSAGKETTCKARDMGSILGSGRSLGEGMATHSGILAWEIPWTEEPGGLQSMESQRVRQDLVPF